MVVVVADDVDVDVVVVSFALKQLSRQQLTQKDWKAREGSGKGRDREKEKLDTHNQKPQLWHCLVW